MADSNPSLLLNEGELNKLQAPNKQAIYVLEWLKFLDQILPHLQKVDVKGCQKKLVEQLMTQLEASPGPPTRHLIARNLATLFSIGDTFQLFECVNKCNDLLRNRDDSPSYLPTRLAAMVALGEMYDRLGRMTGRSYEETVSLLLRAMKNAEFQTRAQIMLTLEKLCLGMGSVALNSHREIYKVARGCVTDRVVYVRSNAARCLLAMIPHAPFLTTSELDNIMGVCFRAFEGANQKVRWSVARFLGSLLAAVVAPVNPGSKQSQQKAEKAQQARAASLEEQVLEPLATAFVKGGHGGSVMKGASPTTIREVRVGITFSYVCLVESLGANWLEHHVSRLLVHLLELASHPKTSSSHVDGVYTRNCVSFILRRTIGQMLGEKAQLAAAKEVLAQVSRLIHSSNASTESNPSSNALICALTEFGTLIVTLGTSVASLTTDPSAKCLDGIASALVLPCPGVRFAAAWSLKCVSSAVPIHLTLLVDRCTEGLEKSQNNPEAILGFSAAVSSLLGAARFTPLGLPHTRGKVMFNVAEELLRCASQNSRLSSSRTTGGWLIIGAVMTLGSSVVRALLPRMMLIWRNTFPRSMKELESEKARGDAFTWKITLEGRGGALASMESFLENCSELANDDIIRRLMAALESATNMVSNIGAFVKNQGQHLKAGSAMVRFRLFSVLRIVPLNFLEPLFPNLLKLLASELTLGDNPANTTTSLLEQMLEDSSCGSIIGSLYQDEDFRMIEEQLQGNSASGSGALEHDSTALYRLCPKNSVRQMPLPLGVAVIDAAVHLFGKIFAGCPIQLRVQVLSQINEAIAASKSSRQEAIQVNVLAAILFGLKDVGSGLPDNPKLRSQKEELKNAMKDIVMPCLTLPNPVLRCAAGETFGRLSLALKDTAFLGELLQSSCEKLKSSRDVSSRTGYSLLLGCLHRYMKGMTSGHQINTSVSILLALSQDVTSPIVQAWSLHALALIAESGGPTFRGYVEPSLGYVLKLLLTSPSALLDMHVCAGRFLAALLTAIGPELQGNSPSLNETRNSFLVAAAILQNSEDPWVISEAVGCLQQLHMFTPRHVNLSTLVPLLCQTLCNDCLQLRRAASSCLRQLVQREAASVCDLAATLSAEDPGTMVMTETGLPGLLLSLLDRERDAYVIKNIQDTLTSILIGLAEEKLGDWILLCKRVLTTASGTETAGGTQQTDAVEDVDVEDEEMKTGTDEGELRLALSQPRWPTRVFAASCVRKLVTVCSESIPAHLDLSLARSHRLSEKPGNFLILYLSDLVRVAFLAAVSDSDPLRLEGLATLQLIVEKFAKVPEPEFPGHVILEQYQAQVSAALRPAFAPEVPSHVTARACQVCSSWICSGVARDLNDVRRIHQLLKSSLCKLLKRDIGGVQILYNESASTLEKLAILKAWAEVYIVAMTSTPTDEDSVQEETLLSLVRPELLFLSKYWLAALKDHALLALPAEFATQLPRDGGAFYTNDILDQARPHYRAAWAPILHAVCLWFNGGGFENVHSERSELDVTGSSNLGLGAANASATKCPDEINSDRFYLVFGICMEALCNPRPGDPIMTCLAALRCLFGAPWPRQKLMEKSDTATELCTVLHRLLLTRDNIHVHVLVTEIVQRIVTAGCEDIERQREVPEEEIPRKGSTGSMTSRDSDTASELEPGKSFVYAVLEIGLCVLVRQLPALNPALQNSQSLSPQLKVITLDPEQRQLIENVLRFFPQIPDLCSPKGSVQVLPTLLILTVGVLKETCTKSAGDKTILATSSTVQASLQTLKALASHSFAKHSTCAKDWIVLLRTSLSNILDLTKTGPEDRLLDEISMLLAVGMFILHSPSSTLKAQNLLYPCVNLFQQHFASENSLVRLKCIQTLRAIFQSTTSEVAHVFINSLAPRIVEAIYSPILKAEEDVLVIQECVLTMESLIAIVKGDHRVEMIGLLIPGLVSFCFLDGPFRIQRSLQQFALQRLMKLGPNYPEDFKKLMTRFPKLKKRLEDALRENQSQMLQRQARNSTSSDSPDPAFCTPSNASAVPRIHLKTDFSNFY